VTENDVTRPQVTGSDPEVRSFDQEVTWKLLDKDKLAYTEHFTCYKAAARWRRQSGGGN